MRITKSGYYKNKGLTTLANAELKPGKANAISRGTPSWREGAWDLFLRIKGVEGHATYDYDIHLSGEELALIVENALLGASCESAVQAQARAIGAYVREILDPKRKPEKKS